MGDRQIHFLGHSAFEIISEKGTRVLLDPYITGNAACPYKLEDIHDPDLIMVSHAAGDHLGNTLEIARRSGCHVICDSAVYRHLRKNNLPREQAEFYVWGAKAQFRDLNIAVVESHHSSIMISDGEFISGLPLGFIIGIGSERPIYFPGDTSIFSDARLLGELYHPKVGMLTAHLEMTGREAALMAKWLGLEVAIPMHDFGKKGRYEEFERELKQVAPQIRCLIMKPGDKVSL